MSDLPLCKKCHRPVRPNRAKKQDYPGSMSWGARGYCASCYASLRASGDLGRVNQYNRSRPEVVRSVPEATGNANESPCVLVRIDLTPATYKTLRRAKVDIGGVLARHATRLALHLEGRDA